MSILNSLNDLATQPAVVAHFANQTQQFTGTELLQEINKVAEIFANSDADAIAFQLDNTPAWLVLDAATSVANKVAIPIAHFF